MTTEPHRSRPAARPSAWSPAHQHRHPNLPGQSHTGPWRQYQVLPTAVKIARDDALKELDAAGVRDEEHCEDVRRVVSELVTNGLCAAADMRDNWRDYERPVQVRVLVRGRWTHLYVTDPNPKVPSLDLGLPDLWDKSGRGLFIVEATAAIWYAPGDYGKTAHAAIPRDGYTITPEDLAALKARRIV